MPKVTGYNRKRIGHRNHLASFQSPPITLDSFGQIDHTASWTDEVSDWPCELISASGGQDTYGEMVLTTTTDVIIGDYDLVSQVNTLWRVVIDGNQYSITAIRDVSGDRRTMRVELKTGHSTIG